MPLPSLRRQMSCRQARERLLAYARRVLTPVVLNRLKQHLDGCPDCRRQLEDVQALEILLYMEAARGYPALDSRTAQRIRLRTARTLQKGAVMYRSNKAIQNLARTAVLTAGFLVVLVGLVYFSSLQLPERQPGVTQESPSGGSVLGEAPAVITFAADESSQPYYEELIEEFNRQTPAIQVQFVPLAGSNFNETAVLASAADTILIPFSLPLDAGAYFRDLQTLLDSDVDFDPGDFWPGLLAACRNVEGRQVGIPVYGSLWGVFFDREAFDTAGLVHPAPGWTLDDFQQYAQLLAGQESGSQRFGFADNLHLSYSILRPYVEASIARSGGAQGNLSLSLAPELQWYIDLSRSGSILPVGGTASSEWEALFLGENRPAMWIGLLSQDMPGSSLIFSPQDPLAGLAISQQGYAPFPSDQGSSVNTTPVSPACAAISAGSKNPRAAWDWLEFLSHQDHVENQGFGSHLLRAPARRSIAEAEGYWDRLPEEQLSAVRYSLEHLWIGVRSPQTLNAVHAALLDALSGQVELSNALANQLVELQGISEAPTQTQEVVVAAPQPTLRPGQSSTRFFFLGLSEEEKAALTTLNQAFNQTHPDSPVRVLFTYDLPEDLNFLRGFSEQFDCYSWYSPGFFDPTEVDYMLALNPFFEAEPASFTQDFYPQQLDLYRSDGRLYGLPATSQPFVMYYNADLLRQRGLEIPTSEWTYEDFLELAEAAASDDPANLSYGFLFDEWEDLFDDFYQVEWMDMQDYSQPRAYFDSPQVLGFLNWLAELREKGVLFVKYDHAFLPAWEAFQAGKIAFWSSPAGNPFTYYFADNMDVQYEIGVLPLPVPPGNGKYIGRPISRGYFISPRSDYPQVCWDWIKYLTEQPNAVEGVPARSSVTASPSWRAMVGEREADAYSQALTQYEDAPLNHIGGAYYNWRHEALRAALSGANLEPLLSSLQAKADNYLACMIESDASNLDYAEMIATRDRCSQMP